MRRREQGDIGEASAIQWLAHSGALVFTPLFRSPDYDLIAEMAGRVVRIEVKTSNSLTRVGNWSVAVCTRGGNQSWNKIAKRFDRNRCDYVFVQVGGRPPLVHPGVANRGGDVDRSRRQEIRPVRDRTRSAVAD